MKPRFNILCICILLAIFGCRQDRVILQPARQKIMTIGEMEILANLIGSESPYSSQADIYLKVEMKNLGDKNIVIPYLLDHPATYTLKNKQTGLTKKIVYQAPATPGTGAAEPHPEAIVESGETVTYRLLIQFPLGFIDAGEYSLQYEVSFPNMDFHTDELDFKVLPQKIGGYSLTPSSSGKSQCLHLTWSDMAATPARILFQRSFIGEQKPLVPNTFAISEADSPATPVASISPPDQDADISWVGWIAKNKLALARITPKNAVEKALLPLPEKTIWSLIPNLNYSHDPVGKDSILTGMLVGRNARGIVLNGFLLKRASGPVWLPPYTLPPGEILAAKLIPVRNHLHLVTWVRYQAGTLFVEALAWDEGLGLGKTILNCASFPMVATAFKSFDAMVQAPGVKWGLAIHDTAPEGNPSTIQFISHSINVQDHRTGPGAPKTEKLPGLAGPLNITLKFDAEGKAWILQRDVHGAWIQSPDQKTPIMVETPVGSRFEDIFFRNGTVPKVILLSPTSGFETKGVNFPDPEVD